MMKFVPQALLDDWADRDDVVLEGSLLRLKVERLAFRLSSAVRFIALIDGEDTHQLVGKVKGEERVREIGGEVMTDSCLVGDTAYQVEPGYLARPATEALTVTDGGFG